jgi:hypothetical protein
MPQNRAPFGGIPLESQRIDVDHVLRGMFADTVPDAGCTRLARKAGLPPNRA